MTLDLPGGRRLVLAGGGLGGVWLGAGVVAVVLLVVLYRTERQMVSRRVGLGLLGLRLLAAAVLVAALFEPVAARSVRETLRGRVVVAVDRSDSMETPDPGRNGEERAKLLSALGLSPAEPLDRTPRREVARRLISGPSAPLARLAADHAVEPLRFADELAPAGSLEDLARALSAAPEPGDSSAGATDWVPVLEHALRAAGSGSASGPVLGVVLVTDGRRNGPGDPGPAVDRLAARGIPVYPVLVGSTRPPTDAAVATLRAPASVYKGDAATIEAVLKLDGYAGQEVEVTLERPGAPPLRQTLLAPGDGSRPVATFRVPLEEPGTVPLTVSVAPKAGDARPDNDRRTAAVQVSDDKARVLLVDGEARWEFRYLRNALARDPRVDLQAVVFRQPGPGLTTDQVFTYDTALPAVAPGGADPLGGFDVVVLGDLAPVDAPAEFWARVERYVSERGGTLVLQPGPKHWAALASNETARKLLPVLDPQPVIPRDPNPDADHPGQPPGTPLVPTSDALRDAPAWPMLQLAAEPEESRRRWSGLPRLPWLLAGRAKPGASVLATAGENSSTDPSESAVLAAQAYGLGKVVWIGTDGTWRWRHRVGDAYHHRFWGQVVRWASTGKLAAGNAFVRFGPLRPRSGEGEPVRLQARVAGSAPGVGGDALLAARVFRTAPGGSNTPAGEAVAVVPLRPLPGQPRAFEGLAPGLAPGTYAVRLDAPGISGALGLDVPDPPTAVLEVTPRDGSERVELAASAAPLEALAAATGGKLFREFEAAGLPDLLKSKTVTAERVEETPLWDQPPALLLFFAILTAEWVMRKRVGLP